MKGGAKVVCRDFREGGKSTVDFCLSQQRHLSNIKLSVLRGYRSTSSKTLIWKTSKNRVNRAGRNDFPKGGHNRREMIGP